MFSVKKIKHTTIKEIHSSLSPNSHGVASIVGPNFIDKLFGISSFQYDAVYCMNSGIILWIIKL